MGCEALASQPDGAQAAAVINGLYYSLKRDGYVERVVERVVGRRSGGHGVGSCNASQQGAAGGCGQPASHRCKSGSGANANRKVKGTLHWVNAEDAVDVETRVYDYLFKTDESDDAEGDKKDFLSQINPNSLETFASKGEAALASYHAGDKFQFLRQGYFVIDKDSTPERLVVNRIVGLRDTWAKMQKKQ